LVYEETVTIGSGTIKDATDVAVRALDGANLTLAETLNVSAQEMAVMSFTNSTVTIQ
jgi:hypothetical protein